MNSIQMTRNRHKPAAFHWFKVLGWEQQRRIELRRIRVVEGRTVYSKLEEAFYLATELGWTREQFMLAAQNVSKARKDSENR